MNEFTVKALGEAIAFSKIGNKTIIDNKGIFSANMSEEDISASILRSNGHIEALESYLKEKKIDTTHVSDSIEKKLLEMKNLYISNGDDVSVLKWFEFIIGALIVEWNMAKGIFETLEDDAMISVSYDAIGYHEDLYDSVSEVLTEQARKNSKQ